MLFFTIWNRYDLFVFHALSHIFKRMQDMFFISLLYKTLRAIARSFFSNISQLAVPHGLFIPSGLYLFIKGSTFDIFLWIISRFFMTSCNYFIVLKTFIIFIYWVYCCFFGFYPIWRIYIRSTEIYTYDKYLNLST